MATPEKNVQGRWEVGKHFFPRLTTLTILERNRIVLYCQKCYEPISNSYITFSGIALSSKLENIL